MSATTEELEKTYGKVKTILENLPETRDSYKLLLLAYWGDFNNYNRHMSQGTTFRTWFLEYATEPSTIERACREVKEDFPALEGEKAKAKKEEADRTKNDITMRKKVRKDIHG